MLILFAVIHFQDTKNGQRAMILKSISFTIMQADYAMKSPGQRFDKPT